MSLSINNNSLSQDASSIGGDAFLYNDRTVAHEMVHAIMDRLMNMASLPDRFKEGATERIQGSDERLANADTSAIGGLDAANPTASSTARFTRAQILQQAASAMLTQANGQPNAVLALLR